MLFRTPSDLGVLADHIEPEDGGPGALLLAGVGDDDHRERGGLRKIRVLKVDTMCCFLKVQHQPEKTAPAGGRSGLYTETRCQSR